jgi:septum formation protein
VTPLVLASTSQIRAALLNAAGVPHETVGSGVDEGEIKERLLAAGAGPFDIAGQLAEAKALKVSRERPGAIVIGADQTLDLDGELHDKARDLTEARRRLLQLRGRVHQLHCGVVAARDGGAVWRLTQSSRLEMREFSDAFLGGYLARNGEAALSSVGCYQLEGEGAQLFERIEGDYFAILGLPLLPLLGFLRREGALAT